MGFDVADEQLSAEGDEAVALDGLGVVQLHP